MNRPPAGPCILRGSRSGASAPQGSRLRMTGNITGHSRDISCPSFALRSALSENRGRRECRVRAAPAVSRAWVEKETHTSIQVQRRQLRHSLRNGFTAYTCSPRRDRALLSPSRQRRLRVVQEDTNHWGVRPTRFHRPPGTFVSRAAAATASHRNTRDDREAPLNRMRRADYTLSCRSDKANYFRSRDLRCRATH
ncbi:hypothetical protein CI1B_09520 [Bradyrhizobium ivorense]|uniref:Uncharacterized protein n=1 Tax=Bradyrhizobium ivorense TaxID=2511166 RepID=A0A508SWD8_9BRAD|nr:hypothetical protein CI1B_09520 [Bradyrhizobium ivorense]